VVKINNGAHDYAMKEDTRVFGPWEYGTKPVSSQSHDWDQMLDQVKKGEIDQIPAQIQVCNMGSLLKCKRYYMTQEYNPSKTIECLWYYGEPGAGKTHKAWTENPSAYAK